MLDAPHRLPGFSLGRFSFDPPLALSPMAGVTDTPFRRVCHALGAGYSVGEMLTSDLSLMHTRKSRMRSDFSGLATPWAVQIAGTDPAQMAQAARHNVEAGAQIIDINMGCPAKKVCKVHAGSALMQDEALAGRIMEAVVKAVPVPVTLKTRLGWDDEHLNVLAIAKLAQECGITALAIHGRSRTQMYRGQARYELIKTVRQETDLPVWANGDIDSPFQAAQILAQTQAQGLMIGRGAQGRPWIFRDIHAWLETGQLPQALSVARTSDIILAHIQGMHDFYGAITGVRMARKHIGWYLADLPHAQPCRQKINQTDDAPKQLALLQSFLKQMTDTLDHWPCPWRAPH